MEREAVRGTPPKRAPVTTVLAVMIRRPRARHEVVVWDAARARTRPNRERPAS